jgi:hypothetical protein
MMTMTDTPEIADLRVALQDAQKIHDQFVNEMNDAIKDVCTAWSSKMTDAVSSVTKAEGLLNDTIAAEAIRQSGDMPTGVFVEWDHPVIPGRTWGRDRSKWEQTGRRAIWMVCTPMSKFRGSKWDHPPIGARFLRLLKKDGTPSLGHVPHRHKTDDWLPEGETRS